MTGTREFRDILRWDDVREVERRQRLGVDPLEQREEDFAASIKDQERSDDRTPISALFQRSINKGRTP